MNRIGGKPHGDWPCAQFWSVPDYPSSQYDFFDFCAQLSVTSRHGAPLVALHKTNAPLLCGLGRMHERADGIKNAGDGLVVSAEFSLDSGFELVQARSQFLVAAIISRSRTKVRMISMLTAVARGLLSTKESIATPCSVKA